MTLLIRVRCIGIVNVNMRFIPRCLDKVEPIVDALQRCLWNRKFCLTPAVRATRSKKANVRIIAATNQALEQAVQEKRFRADLYYRLNVVSIQVPPLRDHREDIPQLAEYFIQRSQKETGFGEKYLSQEAVGLLKQWSWPGNVRELENLIKRAMALSNHDVLLPADISPLLSPPGGRRWMVTIRSMS